MKSLHAVVAAVLLHLGILVLPCSAIAQLVRCSPEALPGDGVSQVGEAVNFTAEPGLSGFSGQRFLFIRSGFQELPFSTGTTNPDSVPLQLVFRIPVEISITRGNFAANCLSTHFVQGEPQIDLPSVGDAVLSTSRLEFQEMVVGSGLTFLTRDDSAENLSTRVRCVNTGGEPLVVSGAVALVSCPELEWEIRGIPLEPVAPGEIFDVEIVLASVNREYFREFGEMTLRQMALIVNNPNAPLTLLPTTLFVFDTAADVPPEYFPQAPSSVSDQWVVF